MEEYVVHLKNENLKISREKEALQINLQNIERSGKKSGIVDQKLQSEIESLKLKEAERIRAL
mgnify:CR=1 FL=1